MKRILFTLLLVLTCAQPALAMEPEDNQNRQIEEIREIQYQRWLQQNAPMAPVPVAQPEEPIAEPAIEQACLNNQLWNAVKKNNTQEVDRLLNAGAHVNAQDKYGFTVLHSAVWNDNQESTIRLLLKAGANVRTLDQNGASPLHLASSRNRMAMAPGGELSHIHQLLIDADAGKKNTCQTLEEAAAHDDISEVARLLTASPKDESQNEHCSRALIWAAQKGHESVCKLLLAHGANTAAKSPYGCTALAAAVSSCHISISKLLIEHGANINAKCYKERSPLIIDAHYRSKSMCKFLLENGADLEIQDEDGKTALMHAAQQYNEAFCRTFITHASFNPFRTAKELRDSQEIIFAALLIFNRFNLPKDVRELIFLAEPELGLDFCCVATNIHRNKHNRAPFMPLQVARQLIQKGLLKPIETVKVLQAHHCKCIRPLMLQALPFAQTDEKRELLNPDNLDANFGYAIKSNIERRLELPETDNVGDADAVLTLQSQNEIGNQ